MQAVLLHRAFQEGDMLPTSRGAGVSGGDAQELPQSSPEGVHGFAELAASSRGSLRMRRQEPPGSTPGEHSREQSPPTLNPYRGGARPAGAREETERSSRCTLGEPRHLVACSRRTPALTRNPSTSSAESGTSRRGRTRERIVGRRAPGLDEVITSTVSAGGSSSSFRNAFAASGLDSCGTMASASPTTNTLRRPAAGRVEASACSACTMAKKYAGARSCWAT